MTIRDVLLPALRAAFPHRGLRAGDTPNVVAVFPAACAEVGDLTIHDDGDEATIYLGHVTHTHFGPTYLDQPEDERALAIRDEVVEFLRELLADRVLLYSVEGSEDGWSRYDGTIPRDIPRSAKKFVWSRRIHRH